MNDSERPRAIFRKTLLALSTAFPSAFVASRFQNLVAADVLIGGSALDESDGSRGQFAIFEETAMYVLTTQRVEEASGWSREADGNTLASAETILFVEDEAFVWAVTCEVLQAAGYRVLTAKNSEEALRIFGERRGDVELLLTDVVLPGETGRALACRLRRENPGLKILLVTGYAEQIERREVQPEEFLAKPFSAESLLKQIRQLLDRCDFRIEKENLVRHACDNA
jgi:CheY-like chemotaxis protein